MCQTNDDGIDIGRVLDALHRHAHAIEEPQHHGAADDAPACQRGGLPVLGRIDGGSKPQPQRRDGGDGNLQSQRRIGIALALGRPHDCGDHVGQVAHEIGHDAEQEADADAQPQGVAGGVVVKEVREKGGIGLGADGPDLGQAV